MDRIKEIEERVSDSMNEYLPIFNGNGEMREWNQLFSDLKYLLEENKRLREVLSQAKDKSQIFASHIAYCKDKYYHLDPEDTFNKAQGVYDLLEQALREDGKE